eukprot:1361277-Amorphochlora_amoeboformis.AAC.3
MGVFVLGGEFEVVYGMEEGTQEGMEAEIENATGAQVENEMQRHIFGIVEISEIGAGVVFVWRAIPLSLPNAHSGRGRSGAQWIASYHNLSNTLPVVDSLGKSEE